MKYKGIIFDLDGTLVDTLEDICYYINLVLEKYGYPLFPLENITSILGMGLKSALKLALPEGVGDDDEYLTRLTDELIAAYDAEPVVKTAPYKGILPLLDELEKLNIPMGIFSNKAHDVTLKVVDNIFGLSRFAYVLGSMENRPRKPAPDGAFIVADKLGVARDEILYVGDTELDHKTALAAGLSDVSVLWGFRTKEQLEAVGAVTFITDPAEILAYFR